MSTKEAKVKTEEVSRRDALAMAGAAVAGVVAAGTAGPKAAEAAEKATKRDASRVSFEIANFTHNVEGIEREKNKTSAVDEYSDDNTFPTARAVYDLVYDRIPYTQDKSDAGGYLFVGDDGYYTIRGSAVDSELLDSSTNPVAGNAIYNKLKEIDELVDMDEKPAICKEDGCEKLHVSKSGGMYQAYQKGNEFPGIADCEQGVTYQLRNSTDITTSKQNWGFRKIDEAFIALCDDEFSGMYLSNNGAAGTWEPPKAIWHS